MSADKQLISHTGEKKEARNPYYLHAAHVYRMLKWGTLLLFTLYLVCMRVWQRESITYDNLLYLIRDLQISSDTEEGFASVTYESQQNMLFGSFQNHLAVVGSSGVRMYDGAGRCVLTDALSYKNPVLESGEKYMLLYDAGGTEYALFTTLARVEQGSSEFPLQYAAVGDSGAYCTVTRSDETKYKVTLYNAAFMETAGYYLDSYVTAAAVHPSGRSVAVLTLMSQEWSIVSGVTFYSASSREMFQVSLGDSLPVSARYLANGTLTVICDDCVVYISEDGKILSRTGFASAALDGFSVSDNKVALICRENVLGSTSRILVLDSAGKTLFDEFRAGKVISVTASSTENAAYILYSDTVETVSVQGTSSIPYTGHLHAVREVSRIPILCFADGACAMQEIQKEQ